MEATLVTEESQEDNADDIQIVHAEAKPLHHFNLFRTFVLCLTLLFIVLIIVVVLVVLAGQSHDHDVDSPETQVGKITQAPAAETFGRPTLPGVSTLQRIKETGVVRCGKVDAVSDFLVQVGGSPAQVGTRAQSEEDFKGANAFTDNFVSLMGRRCMGI